MWRAILNLKIHITLTSFFLRTGRSKIATLIDCWQNSLHHVRDSRNGATGYRLEVGPTSYESLLPKYPDWSCSWRPRISRCTNFRTASSANCEDTGISVRTIHHIQAINSPCQPASYATAPDHCGIHSCLNAQTQSTRVLIRKDPSIFRWIKTEISHSTPREKCFGLQGPDLAIDPLSSSHSSSMLETHNRLGLFHLGCKEVEYDRLRAGHHRNGFQLSQLIF